MALEHLWMHNADWEEMTETGEPLIMVDGKGLRVTDSTGNSWLDVNGGYASVSVGYGQQEIAAAAYEQLQRMCYFPMRTTTPPAILLAAKLAAMTPGSLSRSFLVSGGSEANETALKIARAYHHRQGHSGRYKIISRRDSYHGSSGGVLWLGSVANVPRSDYEPAYPGMLYAPQPNVYRCESASQSAEQCANHCLTATRDLIESNEPETIAALIAEPVASGPGAIVPADGYWPQLRELCDHYGILLIVDEIITGFGRTGKMFASNHWNIVPDIMTLGKGISSSYMPLGAAIVRSEIAQAFTGPDNYLRHVFSFAGHPAAAAVSLKNIEILERERLADQAREIGSYFKQRLQELQDRHQLIGDVRGIGLMLSIELVANRETKERFPADLKVTDRLTTKFKRAGLLLRAHGNTLVNFSPPLCITRDEVDEVVTTVDHSLGEIEREL